MPFTSQMASMCPCFLINFNPVLGPMPRIPGWKSVDHDAEIDELLLRQVVRGEHLCQVDSLGSNDATVSLGTMRGQMANHNRSTIEKRIPILCGDDVEIATPCHHRPGPLLPQRPVRQVCLANEAIPSSPPPSQGCTARHGGRVSVPWHNPRHPMPLATPIPPLHDGLDDPPSRPLSGPGGHHRR